MRDSVCLAYTAGIDAWSRTLNLRHSPILRGSSIKSLPDVGKARARVATSRMDDANAKRAFKNNRPDGPRLVPDNAYWAAAIRGLGRSANGDATTSAKSAGPRQNGANSSARPSFWALLRLSISNNSIGGRGIGQLRGIGQPDPDKVSAGCRKFARAHVASFLEPPTNQSRCLVFIGYG